MCAFNLHGAAVYRFSRSRKTAEVLELNSPLFGPRSLSSPPSEVRCVREAVDCGPEKLVLETGISNPCKNYAPCRLLSRVRIFAVLSRGTMEFGPRAVAVCCERRALGGAWRLVFGRLGRAVKPRRRGAS